MASSASHLTGGQVEQLRAEFARELGKLEKSMEVTDEALQPVKLDPSAVGRLSRIDSLQSQGPTKNLWEREQVKLGMLVEAPRQGSTAAFRIRVRSGNASSRYAFPRASTMAPYGPSPRGGPSP